MGAILINPPQVLEAERLIVHLLPLAVSVTGSHSAVQASPQFSTVFLPLHLSAEMN